MTTIVDVARLAGVSTATVSRVLNANARVDPDLAARVRRAVDELDYRPSRAARTLRTQQSRAWALLVPDVRNPHFTEIVRGIEDVAYQAGYSLLLCNTDEDSTKEQTYLELALAERVTGIILAPTHPPASAIKEVLTEKVAIVTVDRRLAEVDLDTVLVNNIAGAEQAADHLLDCGYRRIACITGPLDTTTGRERLSGFRAALERRGVAVPSRMVRIGDFHESSGRKEMERLLRMKQRPDAVLVANNLMTLGALDAVVSAGLDVPGDVAIVGFDDALWNALARPPLTSVAQPTYDLGRETARLLLSRIDGYDGPAREVTLSPTLRIRASSLPLETRRDAATTAPCPPPSKPRRGPGPERPRPVAQRAARAGRPGSPRH